MSGFLGIGPAVWAVAQGGKPTEPQPEVSKRRSVPQQTSDTRLGGEPGRQIQQPQATQQVQQQIQQEMPLQAPLEQPEEILEQPKQIKELRPAAGESPAQSAAELSQPVVPASRPAKRCQSSPGQAPEMVLIEGGRFRMGSPDGEDGRSEDEGPQHGVAIVKPFALSRCEVTRGEFAAFVTETGYVTDAENGKGCYVLNEARDDLEQKGGTDWRNPEFGQADGHPVVCVSWRDAQAYAAWLSARTGQGYRLPAEAEWEYAARAGTQTSRYWGDDPDAACDYANSGDQSLKASVPEWQYSIAACDDRHAFTAPGGSYQGNGFGLSDMLGNVWEWVQDCWVDNYEQAPADGSVRGATAEGECSRVVLRGGGWDDFPVVLRSAYRGRINPDGALGNAGFRLARTL